MVINWARSLDSVTGLLADKLLNLPPVFCLSESDSALFTQREREREMDKKRRKKQSEEEGKRLTARHNKMQKRV